MSDCITNQAAKHCLKLVFLFQLYHAKRVKLTGRNSVGAVIYLQPKRLLSRCIPHAHDKHKSRVDRSFNSSQQETICGYSCKARACWCSYQNDSPPDCREREEFADWQTLEKVAGWELSKKVTKIEYRAWFSESISFYSSCLNI